MPIRAVVVDDNEQFLEIARVLLEREGIEVVGVASTSAEALRLAELSAPDVVLVDVFLGEESGIELAQQLVADGAATVILISSHARADIEGLVATSPAAGFLTKTDLSAEAIRRVVDERAL